MGSALGNGRRALAEEVPVGYKRTEVGVIPEEWDVASLGEMAKIATGGTPPTHDSTYYGDEYPFVSPVDLGEAKYVTHTEKGLSQKGFAISRRFPAESILFVSIGSTIGKCGVASVELTSNQQINAILPSPSFSVDYLYYTICSAAPRIKALAGEQAVPIVNKTQLSETFIALAPKPEQRAIAEALSDVDELLTALEALIVKKRAIKQAAMQQLLTGESRLPGFSGAWETKRIGDFTDCTAGGTPSTLISEYWGGTIRWMNSGELNNKIVQDVEGRITERGLRESSTKTVPPRCVLVGLAGQGKTRGTVAINTVELCTNQSIAAIYPNESFVSEYLYYNLDARYEELRGMSTGDGGRGGLNLQIILSIVVPFPHVDEQTAIAAVLSDMDVEIAALERRRDKAHVVKQGMMQQLLTGRVRLIKLTRTMEASVC